MICPYCESAPLANRANAKTCGFPRCADAHRKNIARVRREPYGRRVRADSCALERPAASDLLLAECQQELRQWRGLARRKTKHPWNPYSGHMAQRVDDNKEAMAW